MGVDAPYTSVESFFGRSVVLHYWRVHRFSCIGMTDPLVCDSATIWFRFIPNIITYPILAPCMIL